ncbi:Uncharacterized protein TPAR_03784 [Tolypocladium paradoxum]|uniref:DUF4048 domain-containing protein n=1 Tax=Tolypocladium paradoxum TaxID=94208 RepID=A0A2S4L0Q8_9HYPO|nr:Uncharacterized protein TPAR_03784 [Tolypocladium paradoxum]
MTGFLLQLCAADRCSLLVSHGYRHLTQAHHKALAARAASAARLRRRKANGTPSAHSQKRRRLHGSHSFRKLLHRHLDIMASRQEIRRRSSATERTPFESTLTVMAMANTCALPPDVARAHRERKPEASRMHKNNGNDAEIMPPPPLPSQGGPSARQSRSDSAASRITNRLSLTLPIAPPTSDPSRPALISAATPSIPPTPVETSTVTSPSDANEFIIAIAAQERRVLELREELARAEADLVALKKEWTSKEPYHKRGASSHVDLQRNVAPGPTNDDTAASRRSVELDRRKLLLQNQNQGTPTQNRRRVLRGGHTRTLSLLSPARTNSEFSVREDSSQEEMKLPPLDRRTAQLTNPALSKRASWQPRSAQNSPVVPQLVEDFKLGLRAFVEDIRQITVGDEPVTGRGTPAQQPGGAMNRGTPGDPEKPRSGHAARLKGSTALDSPNSGTSAPTPASKSLAPSLEKHKPTKSKHFSWTPLGFDSLDDNDWSNWESPGPSKSPRWSGSTVNSAGLEDIGSIPEAGEENNTPAKTKSTVETPILSPKLEEILPSVVNRLSPSNLKRTANSLMDEWERSLVAPEATDKESKA